MIQVADMRQFVNDDVPHQGGTQQQKLGIEADIAVAVATAPAAALQTHAQAPMPQSHRLGLRGQERMQNGARTLA